MTYKSHAAIGTVIGISASCVGNLSALPSLLLISSCYVGSMLPDIDHPKSFICNRIPILKLTTKYIHHRGVTHSPIIWTTILFILLCCIQSDNISIILLVGGLSHILLDFLTCEGVPILYPFSKIKLNILPIRTGSKFEKVIVWTIALSILYYSFI